MNKEEEEAKQAEELLERISYALKNEDLSPELREELEVQQAALAGLIVKPWLPRGIWRKAIMIVCLYFGITNVLQGNWWYSILIFVASIFSPHIVGLYFFYLGIFGKKENN